VVLDNSSLDPFVFRIVCRKTLAGRAPRLCGHAPPERSRSVLPLHVAYLTRRRDSSSSNVCTRTTHARRRLYSAGRCFLVGDHRRDRSKRRRHQSTRRDVPLKHESVRHDGLAAVRTRFAATTYPLLHHPPTNTTAVRYWRLSPDNIFIVRVFRFSSRRRRNHATVSPVFLVCARAARFDDDHRVSYVYQWFPTFSIRRSLRKLPKKNQSPAYKLKQNNCTKKTVYYSWYIYLLKRKTRLSI